MFTQSRRYSDNIICNSDPTKKKNNGTNTSETDMIRSFILAYDSIMMRFVSGSTPNFHMDLARRQNVQYHLLLLRVQVDSLCCPNLISVVKFCGTSDRFVFNLGAYNSSTVPLYSKPSYVY